jgi:hypothetical protein
MKQTTYIVIILCTIILYARCEKPHPTGKEYDTINTFKDPVQIPFDRDTSFVLSIKDGSFKVSLVARYRLAGLIVSSKTFSRGWESQLVPIDLAVCWGEIVKHENLKYISFTQKGRWYYFNIDDGSSYDQDYVYTHSSNNHIIPANKNVLLAVKSIAKKTPVELNGYLVNIDGTFKGESCWWFTSRVRTDRAQGSCELFYVTKVRIGNNVYQ